MKNLIGSHWALTTLPDWAIVVIIYVVTMGAIFFLRDKFEGVFYNTSYSAMLGEGALAAIVLVAADVLHRGVSLPGWVQVWSYHIAASVISIVGGVALYILDPPKQWADRYHHLVIVPLLLYLGFTLLPVVFDAGTKKESVATILLLATWIALFIYDLDTHRLNQRNYRNLGHYLALVKSWRHR